MIDHKIPVPGAQTVPSPLFGKSRAEAERKPTGRGTVGLLERIWQGCSSCFQREGSGGKFLKALPAGPYGPIPCPKEAL